MLELNQNLKRIVTQDADAQDRSETGEDVPNHAGVGKEGGILMSLSVKRFRLTRLSTITELSTG